MEAEAEVVAEEDDLSVQDLLSDHAARRVLNLSYQQRPGSKAAHLEALEVVEDSMVAVARLEEEGGRAAAAARAKAVEAMERVEGAVKGVAKESEKVAEVRAAGKAVATEEEGMVAERWADSKAVMMVVVGRAMVAAVKVKEVAEVGEVEVVRVVVERETAVAVAAMAEVVVLAEPWASSAVLRWNQVRRRAPVIAPLRSP